MTPDKPNPLPKLRRKAKKILADLPADDAQLSPAQTQTLIHELRVHQAELEIQNEELRRTHAEVIEWRDACPRLFHRAPVGYLSLDAKGVVRQVNDTFCLMTGHPSAADVVRRHFARFVAPPDDRVFRARFASIFAHPEGKQLETRLAKRDGGSFHVRITARKTADNQRLLLAVADVDDLHRSGEELLRSREQFRLAVLGSHDGIWDWNIQTNDLYISARW